MHVDDEIDMLELEEPLGTTFDKLRPIYSIRDEKENETHIFQYLTCCP